EAFDAGDWARALVEAWVAADAAPRTAAEFGAWAKVVGARHRERWVGRELPWYAEEKARAGSFAAFVGLSLEAGESGLSWHACALGDSCLVQLRGGIVRASVPLDSHQDFNSYPLLVPTHAATAASALTHTITAQGEACAGDTFLLLSDAAAAWFFMLSAERAPLLAEFDALLAARDDAALAELFRAERRAGRIKNDDVAAVRVAVGGVPA
ncbi:MAG: hypothetical protein ACJ741_16950, partial [Pyrinomonadaceae bacterium]